ncbi:MAG: hypothetical protein L6Q92_04635 [Phycisphaerae bacterium]|nr:hypothetical protein [Phycisphaerae bacterium]
MDFRDIEAVQTILKTLGDFEPTEQERILRWVAEKLELKGLRTNPVRPPAGAASPTSNGGATAAGDALQEFSTVGDLMAAVHAETAAERALVVATFLQYRTGKGALTGFEVNSELKHLGHAVGNITDTLTALQTAKPALVIQVRKSGTTRQARKQYKVTDAGYRRVIQLLEQGTPNEES